MLVSSELCQKLSEYEKDYESFEKIFLEQLLRVVFVIAEPPTMGVGTSEEYWRTSVI